MQRLRHAADHAGNGLDGRPLRRVLAAMLQHHAHGALAHLGENFGDFFMAPFSRVGASVKPGAIKSDGASDGPCSCLACGYSRASITGRRRE